MFKVLANNSIFKISYRPNKTALWTELSCGPQVYNFQVILKVLFKEKISIVTILNTSIHKVKYQHIANVILYLKETS